MYRCSIQSHLTIIKHGPDFFLRHFSKLLFCTSIIQNFFPAFTPGKTQNLHPRWTDCTGSWILYLSSCNHSKSVLCAWTTLPGGRKGDLSFGHIWSELEVPFCCRSSNKATGATRQPAAAASSFRFGISTKLEDTRRLGSAGKCYLLANWFLVHHNRSPCARPVEKNGKAMEPTPSLPRTWAQSDEWFRDTK